MTKEKLVYEWKWCVVMNDNTGILFGYHTEDSINKMLKEGVKIKIKIDSSKRERK